jgi:mRNA interferase RelE/StbE
MARYRPDIPPRVAEVIRQLPPEVKRGIRTAIQAISGDPALGEPLQRELEGIMKYRVRRYRVVYTVERKSKTIRIMAGGHRRAVYEELADLVRSSR